MGGTVTGGDGTDTLTLTAAASTFSATNLTGFETIIVPTGTVSVTYPNPAAVAYTANTGALTVVSGAATSAVTVAAELITAGATILNLSGATPYTITNLNSSLTFSGSAASTASLEDDAGVFGSTVIHTGTGLLTLTNATSSIIATADLLDSGDTLTLSNTQAGGITLTNMTYNVTDSATRTGTLTITTSGTEAVAVTEAVGSTGNTAITHTGSGLLTLTPITGGTTTVTHTAAGGSVTVTNATVGATINAAAATSAVTLTGGIGGDSIVGGTLADTIRGGSGVDTLTGGTGNDVFVFLSADSGVLSGVTLSTTSGTTTAVWAAGTVLSLGGIDQITDFSGGTLGSTGDRLALSDSTNTVAPVRNLGSFGDNNDGVTGLIVGTVNAAGTTFTVDAAGTSSMYVYDTDGTGVGVTVSGILLVGYVDTFSNDVNGSSTITSSTAGTGLVGTGG
jgi:hypothetical protein